MFAVVVLAALVVLSGCQGAVGPKGPQGDPGKDGTSGTDGTDGTDGINVLLATGGIEYVLVNDKIVDGVPALGDKPADFDVSGHFQGGTGTVTFTSSTESVITNDGLPNETIMDSATTYYEVTVTEAGMASLSLRPATENPEAPDMDGEDFVVFIVTGTDANKLTATKTIVVQKNSVPVAATTDDIDINVGTQAVENPIAVDGDANPPITATDVTAEKALRPMLNQHRLQMTNVHFTDAEFASLEFTADSSAPAVASVTVDNDKQVIVITGLQGTDIDAGTATPAPPTITVKATDAGRLVSTASITITVTVIAAPVAAKDTAFANLRVAQGINPDVNAVPGFFTPATGLTITATSSRPSVAAVPNTNITAGMEVMTLNVGSTTITLKAIDTITQYVTREFTVTVTEPTGN